MSTAADYGMVTPTGTDLISNGDNAITTNAQATAAQFDRIGAHTIIGNDLLAAGYDDLLTLPAGSYTIPNQPTADAMQNMPEVTPGVINVAENLGSPVSYVEFFPHNRDHHWVTQTANVSGAWVDWRKITGEAADGNPAATGTDLGQMHTVRRAEFKRRRGGRIGTAGKPVVALRWDHGLVNFRDKIMPHLTRLGLPGSMAMNSADNRWIIAESNGVTPANLESYAIENGVEVWNHGQTHGGAETLAALTREIEQGRIDLQAKLPNIPIEGFVIPGVPSGDYGGFSAGQTVDHWNTEAGRLILGNHAVSSSHIAGTDQPIHGDQPILSMQYSIDSLSANTVKAAVDRAVVNGAGIILFLHPSQLDLSGKMSAADYVAILEHIAARRAAGDLEVLTMGGLSVADAGSQYRHDLVYDSEFSRGTEAWGSDPGFSVDEDGAVTSGSSSAYLTQSVSLTGREWAKGSPRELVVEYRGRDTTSSLTVEVTIGDTTRTVTHDVAPVDWQEMRVPVIVPLNASSVPISIRRVSGRHVHIRSARFQTI